MAGKLLRRAGYSSIEDLCRRTAFCSATFYRIFDGRHRPRAGTVALLRSIIGADAADLIVDLGQRAQP